MRSRSVVRPGSHRRSPLRQLARAASWHRRKLAVLAAVATVLTGLAAAAPPAPASAPVVRSRVALAGGQVLSADDLEVVELPQRDLPDRTFGDPARLVGRRLAAPAPRHQVLTTEAVASPDAVTAPGHVLAPVRLADADVVALLEPGDLVDVIAATAEGGATGTVARSVRVVTVPAGGADDQDASAGALVLLDVLADDAEPLAGAAARGGLTVVWP